MERLFYLLTFYAGAEIEENKFTETTFLQNKEIY
jgi:hypothetical protein